MKRKYVILIVIMGLLGNCIQCQAKKTVLKIQIITIKQINPDSIKGQQYVFYNIEFEVFNNTDSEVRYWTMSCSWQDLWVFNTKEIIFTGKNCDSNYPTLTQILPGQKKFFNATVKVNKGIINKEDCKIGFILVKKNESDGFLTFDNVLSKKKKEQKDIIWSESFKMQETPEVKIPKVKPLFNN